MMRWRSRRAMVSAIVASSSPSITAIWEMGVRASSVRMFRMLISVFSMR